MDVPFPVLVHSPARGHNHTHTVIFLHGRGETPRRFAERLDEVTNSHGQSLMEAFPTVRWVFAIPAGTVYQWFPVWDSCRLNEQEELQLEGLQANVARIRLLVEVEANKFGGRYERIILAGFDQGASVAIHTLFNLKIPGDGYMGLPRLGALLLFSGRLPFDGRNLRELRSILNLPNAPRDTAVVRHTPTLIEHCVDDPIVQVSKGIQLYDTLQSFGGDATWRQYDNGRHWFNQPGGIDDAIAFLGMTVGLDRAEVAPAEEPEDEATVVMDDDMDLS
ncbi:hypothetical protein FDECE_3260 [Fusarium decemcellulare]|nr:hypothetical protein FDECE_3260 [Fusarium decemcellulare]